MVGVWLLILASAAALHVVVAWASAWRRGRRGAPSVWPHRLPVSTLILVPVWNDANVIERTLRALAREIRGTPQVEVVAVAGGDDGSFDVTWRAFDALGLPGRVLPQQPDGKNAALNHGLRASSSDVVVFLDADTEVTSGWLAALCGPIASGRADATAGLFTPIRETSVTRIFEIDQLVSQIVLGNVALFGGGTIAVARHALEAIGGTLPEDVLVGVDWDLSERLKAVGMRLAFVADARVKTELPRTWRELFNNELRWKRAYLTSQVKHLLVDRRPLRLLGLLYVPLVQGLTVAGWLLFPALAALAGVPVAAGLALWLLFVAWVLFRHVARCLTAYAHTGDTSYLVSIPAYALGFVVTSGASWTAILTLRRLSPHFKGHRPKTIS